MRNVGPLLFNPTLHKLCQRFRCLADAVDEELWDRAQRAVFEVTMLTGAEGIGISTVIHDRIDRISRTDIESRLQVRDRCRRGLTI